MFSLLPISASYISNTLSISRNTIYRHDKLLLRYIDFLNSTLSSGNPIEEIKLLKIQLAEKENQINKLLNRDVDVELLKQEFTRLTDILKEKNNQLMEKDKIIMNLKTPESSQSNNKNNGIIHKINSVVNFFTFEIRYILNIGLIN